MVNSTFYIDAASLYEEVLSPVDRPAQSADLKTYPRRMSVYQNDRKKRRTDSFSMMDDAGYHQRQGGKWNRLYDETDRPKAQRRSPFKFAYLSAMYREVPEPTEKAAVVAQNEPEKRPAGWRLFLILLSGALPYIAVSLPLTSNI